METCITNAICIASNLMHIRSVFFLNQIRIFHLLFRKQCCRAPRTRRMYANALIFVLSTGHSTHTGLGVPVQPSTTTCRLGVFWAQHRGTTKSRVAVVAWTCPSHIARSCAFFRIQSDDFRTPYTLLNFCKNMEESMGLEAMGLEKGGQGVQWPPPHVFASNCHRQGFCIQDKW